MTVTDPRAETATPPTAANEVSAPELTHRPGRWIDDWNPENAQHWAERGKAIAGRNLRWSIFAEFLGFVVWQLWSVVVVSLPAAGFQLSTGDIFWLISMPSLVGATLRIPYTFMVPRSGGRNWTIVSAGLLLIPTIGLAIAVSNPQTPFGVLLLIAALAGFGGGQPRRLGRAVRRPDRHHGRSRRHPEPAARGSHLGSAGPRRHAASSSEAA